MAILLFLLTWPTQAAGSIPDDEIFSTTALMIGQQQVTTPTTLTVEIVSSPWVVVDSNGQIDTPDGELPSVYVVAARVTNTGTVAAENVEVTLDYQEVLSWTLLSGEDPVRTVDSLGPGETFHVYWFARYPQTVGTTHQYTVSAKAGNAPLTGTSENTYEPSGSQTVETRSAIGSANQALAQTTIDVTVGYTFRMTQTFDLGTNPRRVAFNPVGNPSFDPSAYRLLSVTGQIFNGSDQPVYTLTDEVYVENLDDTAATATIVYTFLALLPQDTRVCPYAGIGFQTGQNFNEKYDKLYCSEQSGTIAPVAGSISLDLSKSVNLPQAEQDQILQYTIAYTNTGDRPLFFSWIWDELPANTVLLTDTISPASGEYFTATNQVVWNLGEIPPSGSAGSSGSLSFSARVDGAGADIPDGEALVNTAAFGINPGNTLPARKALTATTTSIVQAPVITISKTAGQDTANPGDAMTYTIRITNTGSTSASDIVVVDKLPDGLLLNGAPTPNISSQVAQTLTWNTLSDIAGGGGVLEITVPVRVNPNLSDTGTFLTNISDITFKNSAGYTFTPQTASDVTLVVVPSTDLQLNKTGEDLNGAPLVVSDTVRYTLQVTNTGAFTAYNVTVTDDLPPQVTCQNVSDGLTCANPLIWNVGNLAANGGTASLTIDATINPGTVGQSITNSATVTATNVVNPPAPPVVCPDGSAPVGDSCGGTTPVDFTQLSLSKSAKDVNGEALVVGDVVSYTLQVTNTGTVTAYNVVITDNLPAQVTCHSSNCVDPLIWNVGDLAANGGTASFTFDVTINAGTEGQSIINSAAVTSSNVVDPPAPPEVCPDGSTPNGDICPETPVGTPKLELAKSAEDLNGAPLVVSDTVRYTLQVTNTGSFTAYNVTVTDNLPTQVTCQNVSDGLTCADPLIWNVGDLAANGGTASLTFDVTINEGTEGQSIINSATVTSSNVVNPPAPPEVCPDGSTPVGDTCDVVVTPPLSPPLGSKVYLPIVIKN